MKRFTLLPQVFVPALVLLALPAMQQSDDRDSDPPSRVARLSFITGDVSFRPGDVDDWTDATLNYPLRGGDHLWTDADARAEISLGSSVIRLDQWTDFGLLALDDRTTQIDLSEGSLDVRVRRLDSDDVFEIDTPNGAVSLEHPGTYRIDVDSAGDTTVVTVRGGEGEVTAAGESFSVDAGQVGIVFGRDAPSYDITGAAPPDDWERWCASRDRRWDESRSTRYVSPDMVGYEDLDDYGDWRDGGGYGPVWIPRDVDDSWAPYRYGHWAWVEPWGWTWIDDARWGFAPFHYGRWVWFYDRWAWVPGRNVPRPVYAPALVAFVGGPRWSLTLAAGGTGGVAWFPLAPDEVYVPAYHASTRYIRNVNVTNVNVTNINVTNIDVTNVHYRNRDVPRAVTGASDETFTGARSIGHNAVIVPRERLTGAVVVGTAAPLAPTRTSVLAQPAPARARRPPEAVVERRVIVRNPPPPPPVPFTTREPVLRTQPGRPLDQSIVSRLRESQAPDARGPRVKPAVPAAGTESELRPMRGGLPAPHKPPPQGVIVPPPETPPTAQPSNAPPPTAQPTTAPSSNALPSNEPQRPSRRRGPPPREETSPPTGAPAPANTPPELSPPRHPDRGHDRPAAPDSSPPRDRARPDHDKGHPDTSSTAPPKKRPRPLPKRGERGDTTRTKPDHLGVVN